MAAISPYFRSLVIRLLTEENLGFDGYWVIERSAFRNQGLYFHIQNDLLWNRFLVSLLPLVLPDQAVYRRCSEVIQQADDSWTCGTKIGRRRSNEKDAGAMGVSVMPRSRALLYLFIPLAPGALWVQAAKIGIRLKMIRCITKQLISGIEAIWAKIGRSCYLPDREQYSQASFRKYMDAPVVAVDHYGYFGEWCGAGKPRI